jgi:hypothetical protein
MVAASFAIRSGDGVQINAPSEANMRANKKPILGPGNGWRFLKKCLIDRVPLAIPGFDNWTLPKALAAKSCSPRVVSR